MSNAFRLVWCILGVMLVSMSSHRSTPEHSEAPPQCFHKKPAHSPHKSKSVHYLHVVLRYDPQKVDVVVRVEAGHVLAADGLGSKHLHLAVQPVVHHQVVGHANTVRFHRVSLTVVVVPDLGCQQQNAE